MPLIEPAAKHRYTAKVSIVLETPDPVLAFQTATELLRRTLPGSGTYGVGFIVHRLEILQAEVELIPLESALKACKDRAR
jgi:hypothetical protein